MTERIETEAEIYQQDEIDASEDDVRFSSMERESFNEYDEAYNDHASYDPPHEAREPHEPTFEDLNNFIDSLTMKVNELDFGLAESEENDSKESTDSTALTDTDIPDDRSRRSGSILKHPGQKRTHIKHVEFLDVIADDKQNCDNVRYF